MADWMGRNSPARQEARKTENEMKTNVTYVDAAKFETLITASELPMTAQKGFIKVQGPKGNAVYVASTKRVGRVDISGFTVEYGVAPHCGPFGNVKQQLNFGQTEEAILEDFTRLLADLKLQAPVEKPVRKPAAPKANEPKGWSPDIKESRKAKIAKHASQA
jgi:hypothetical protein